MTVNQQAKYKIKRDQKFENVCQLKKNHTRFKTEKVNSFVQLQIFLSHF